MAPRGRPGLSADVKAQVWERVVDDRSRDCAKCRSDSLLRRGARCPRLAACETAQSLPSGRAHCGSPLSARSVTAYRFGDTFHSSPLSSSVTT